MISDSVIPVPLYEANLTNTSNQEVRDFCTKDNYSNNVIYPYLCRNTFLAFEESVFLLPARGLGCGRVGKLFAVFGELLGFLCCSVACFDGLDRDKD